VDTREIAVLLVRECLQRRRVEGLRTGSQRALDGVLRDHRLPRACRRRDQHVLALVDGVERVCLERVEREAAAGFETPAQLAVRRHRDVAPGVRAAIPTWSRASSPPARSWWSRRPRS
jgi:hypothetical protein